MLAGAAALLVAPKPVLAAPPAFNLLAAPPILRAGDRLSVKFSGTGEHTSIAILLEESPQSKRIITGTWNGDGSGVVFVAKRDYIITKATISTAGATRDLPVTIIRSTK